MKTKLILMLIFVLSAGLFSCDDLIDIIDGHQDKDQEEPQRNTLSEGLLAYWSFDDGTARDYSGNHLDGKMFNNPIVVPGVQGRALKFTSNLNQVYQNGSDGAHIIIPTINFRRLEEFSISLWAKDELNNYLFGEYYIFFGDHERGWLGIGSHKSHTRDNELMTFMSVGANIYPRPPLPIEIPYYAGRDKDVWRNYTLVYHDGILFAYKDGVLVARTQQSVRIGSNNAAIGRHWWTPPEELNSNYSSLRTAARLNATLDEIRIYNRALNQEEITRLSKQIVL